MVWKCEKCNKKWYHNIDICINCGNKLTEIAHGKLLVKGVTKVNVPSIEHDQVPYYVLLLEDAEGNLHVQKTFKKHNLGQVIEENQKSSKEEGNAVIGIIGTGTMGRGLCQLFIQKGYKVILKSRDKKSLDNALKDIENSLLKIVNEDEKNRAIEKIKTTTDFSNLSDANLVIEASIEDMKTKKEIFKNLARVCPENVVFATNTSSLSINELSNSVSDPSKFIGMHFFNPPQKMNLVEVVRSDSTSDETVEFVKKIAESLDKTAIVVTDSPGFIVNRVLMTTLNEAMYLLESGIASPENIDNAIKLGLNHPMGPLALADLIGLDVCLEIMETLYKKLNGQKYQPCPLLKEMVKNGFLGKKSGKGFYNYERPLDL